MVGIIVVSHENIGKEMVAVVKKIIPDCPNLASVSIKSDLPAEANIAKIREAIKAVDRGKGVILLTDLFGGTPANLCITFLEKGKVEVISGVNLPMLIKLAGKVCEMTFEELTDFIRTYGRKNIVIASEVLEGRVEYK